MRVLCYNLLPQTGDEGGQRKTKEREMHVNSRDARLRMGEVRRREIHALYPVKIYVVRK